MNNEWYKSDKYNNAELKQYTSLSALSSTTGIPKAILRIAKKLDAPGCATNAKIDWAKLKPWFEDHYEELTSSVQLESADLKAELQKRDIRLKDLQIRKLERNLLEPDEVKLLLVELATKLSVILKTVFAELPPRLTGQAEPAIKLALDKAQQDIFTVLQSSGQNVDKLAK
jgi:hypothetical protein